MTDKYYGRVRIAREDKDHFPHFRIEKEDTEKGELPLPMGWRAMLVPRITGMYFFITTVEGKRKGGHIPWSEFDEMMIHSRRDL